MDDQSRSAGPHDPRVDAALREYLERLDRGELVDRDAFLSQHAEIADELRSFLAGEEVLRLLADAGSASERATISTKSFADRGQETSAPRSMAKPTTEPETTGLTGQFGRYRIVKALGKGAMGMVYLAEDTQLRRQVALKTPRFEQEPTPELLERFYREARAAATLRHPNICMVNDVGQIDGTHYISMAFIEGHPLSSFIRPDKRQNERHVLIVIRKLAQALQEAHDHGIVHRDLKPANIMVDKRNEPIIMDFGLARRIRQQEEIRLTQSGVVVGTPAYMSPEQVEGEPDRIGPATDQYSLGVILYELLSGELPFRGSLGAVMGQIVSNDPKPLSQQRPGLDPRIEAICQKMMAKNPSNRFPSLSAVAEALATIVKNPATRAASQESKAASPEKSAAFLISAAPDRPAETGAGASSIVKSTKQKALTESDLASLEELARKCYSRRDFEQVIQVVEQIPAEKRNAGLAALLEKSRAKADEVAYLICEIDEAVRFNDRGTALKKADELLAIKPGQRRALKVRADFAGHSERGAARVGPMQQFTRPWNEGGWIPWGVLAFGLAVFGAMTAVIVIYLDKSVIVIDIRDPDMVVTVKGKEITITGPKQEKVYVKPGEQELTISYAGLETKTKRFELKRGQERTVRVSIVGKEIVAQLDSDPSPPVPDSDKVLQNKPAAQRARGGPAKVAERRADIGQEKIMPKNAKAAEFQTSAPLAHFRFDGNANNEGQGNAQFELQNTIFKGNALYLNGKYQLDSTDGYRAVCSTPEFEYETFSVVTRFKAEDFHGKKDTILVGGTSYRWFGMIRSKSGNLVITLNNQKFAHEIVDAPLDANKWTTVGCGVDLPARKIVAYINGKKAAAFDLPADFKLVVIGSKAEKWDKKWSFTNYGTGHDFQGLVGELIVYNRFLSPEEFIRDTTANSDSKNGPK